MIARDYRVYSMGFMESVKYSLLLMGFICGLSYFFYAGLWISIIISPTGLFLLPAVKKWLLIKRKEKLKKQFKEGIYALSSSISVGKSVESAFVDALEDLKLFDQKNNYLIITEFEIIVRKIMNNETIEEALIDFSVRGADEDITDFVNVFVVANRAGGNLVKIMKFTTDLMNEKMEIDDKIKVLISEKQYEQKMMYFLLPFIVAYLHLFSGGFMHCMYHSIQGRVVMTVVLILYLVSFYISRKIVDIKV